MTKAEIISDGLVPIREAARFLGCSRKMIYLLQARGELPIVYIGKNRKVPVSSLRRIAEDNLVVTAQQ